MSKKSGTRKQRNESETSEARLAKRYLYRILCVGLLLIPIRPSIFPGMNNSFYYLTIMVAAVLAGGMLWAIYKTALSFIYTPFFIALGVWVGAKLITTVTSTYPYHSFWGNYLDWSDGFLFALALGVIVTVIVSLKLDNRRIIRLIGLLAAEAVVFSVITIGQSIAAGFFYQQVRPNSPLGNADFFLSYLLLFVPILLILLVKYLRAQNWWKVTIYGISSLIMLSALFMSMPTHLQAILLPSFDHGKVDTTAGAADTQSVTAGNFTQDTANVERWTEWRYGIQFGLTRPLIGTGPSTTSEAFEYAEAHHTINKKGWNDGVVMDHSHNDFIEQFSQEGVIGVVAYLVLWAGLIFLVIKNRRNIDPKMRPFAIGLGVGLLLWLGFNQLLFTTVVAGLVAFVWLALLLAMVGQTREIQGRLPTFALAGVTVVLVFASFWLGRYWVDDIRVDLAISTADQLQTQSSVGIAQDADSLAIAAANDMPYEPYYNEMAAVTSLEAYPISNDPAYVNQMASNALKYARKMISEGPNSTEYMGVIGTVQYAVSPIGSSGAKQGLAYINQGISIAPNDPGQYESAAGNAIAKKDYATARKYIALGLAANLKATDKQKLRKLEATLPD